MVRHVEELSRERQELVFQLGNSPNGRLVEKMNDCRALTVDCVLGGVFAGQKIGDELKRFAVITSEIFAVILHGDVDAQTHEFINAVHYCVELVRTWPGVCTFVNFARQSAINYCRRRKKIAGFEFANANAKYGKVHLICCLRDVEFSIFVGKKTVRRDDSPELPVIAHFNQIVCALAFIHVTKVLCGEVEKNFGKAIVWEKYGSGRVNLHVKPCYDAVFGVFEEVAERLSVGQFVAAFFPAGAEFFHFSELFAAVAEVAFVVDDERLKFFLRIPIAESSDRNSEIF